jgi:hypothetical protein
LRQFASVTSRSGAGEKSSIRAAVVRPPRFFFLALGRNPDHFSASFEPDRRSRRQNIAVSRRFLGKKLRRPMEQKAFVAAPSQLRTITAPTLPRSNQIDATLFD